MRKPSVYRFPANKRAEAATLAGQLRKLLEECFEVLEAYEDNEGDVRIIEELWDVIQAAEGALRKFPLLAVLKGLAMVKIKSRQRGDYRKEAR